MRGEREPSCLGGRRWLLAGAWACALLLPAMIFGLVSWREHGAAIAAIKGEARHGARVIHEHVLKIFETQALVVVPPADSQRGKNWEQIPKSGAPAPQVAELTRRFHGRRFILVVGRSRTHRRGSKIIPAPALDVRDRDYYQAA